MSESKRLLWNTLRKELNDFTALFYDSEEQEFDFKQQIGRFKTENEQLEGIKELLDKNIPDEEWTIDKIRGVFIGLVLCSNIMNALEKNEFSRKEIFEQFPLSIVQRDLLRDMMVAIVEKWSRPTGRPTAQEYFI